MARPPALTPALLLLLAACNGGDDPDAYGNFEATEVVVSAETSGQLLHFTPEEGATVDSGALVAVVDTTQLLLQESQLTAQRGAGQSRVGDAANQVAALEAQYDVAKRSYERTQRLFDQQAATAQQRDQAEREFRVLAEQIQGARSRQRATSQEVNAGGSLVDQVRERIRQSRVTAPMSGTVLVTYAERGEYVQPGQPLFKMARLDTLTLRAYVAQPSLATIRLGQTVDVTVDSAAGERITLPGVVSWISSQAEFTPTPIQTREERAGLVYAVKILVPNANGTLKLGMPADVRLHPAAE